MPHIPIPSDHLLLEVDEWNYPDKPDGKLGYKKVVICHDDKTKKKV